MIGTWAEKSWRKKVFVKTEERMQRGVGFMKQVKP